MSLHHVCTMLERYETCVVPRPRCLHLPNLHCTAVRSFYFRARVATLGHGYLAKSILLERFFFLFHNPVNRMQPFCMTLSLMFLSHVHQNPRTPLGRRVRRRAVPEAEAWGGGRVSWKPAGCPKRQKRRRITLSQLNPIFSYPNPANYNHNLLFCISLSITPVQYFVLLI